MIYNQKMMQVMKKIIAFFVALVVTSSLLAMPKKLHDDRVKYADRTSQMEKMMGRVKTAERKALVKPELSVQNQAPSVAAAQLAPTNNADDVTVLNFDDVLFYEYYPETGDWFISMSCEDETRPENGYIVKFDYIAAEEDRLGTFTEDDLDRVYSYMYTPHTPVVYYDEITLTISEEVISSSLSQIHIDAYILGDDGKRYEVHCIYQTLIPKNEIETLIAGATVAKSRYDFTLAGKNDEMDVSLVVMEPDYVIGHFDADKIDLNRSVFLHNGSAIYPMDDIVVDIEAAEIENALSYVAEVSFMSTDTNTYHLTIISPLPTPTDTVELVCHNLCIDNSWAALGIIFATASNEDWLLDAAFPGYVVEGTYSDEITCYLTNQHTYEEVDALQVDVEMKVDENGNWMMTGFLRCTDNVVYDLYLTWTVPTPSETVNVRFETSAVASFWVDSDYELQLQNENGDYQVSLDVYGLQPGDTFDWQNVGGNYCFVKDLTTREKYQVADVRNGVLEQVGDTTKLTASMICFNAVQYEVEIWYVVPTPEETVEMTIPVTFSNILDYGMYQLYGYTDDESYFVTFTPITEQVSGTFINDGMFGRFGTAGGRYDLVNDYTYIAVYNPEMEYYDIYNIEKGEMTVVMDANEQITATVDVICNNAVRYVLTLTSKFDVPHLEYDEPEIPVDRTYTSADIVEIEDVTEELGLIYFYVKSEEHDDVTALYFFAEEPAVDIIIPEGNYPINASEASGSVMANPGVQNGGVYPSYYSQLEPDGLLKSPLWLLTGGNVEVTKNAAGKLHFEVNAVNSYNVPVHIVYDDTNTGIEDILLEDTPAVKKITKDGQLLIFRNGKVFNAVGMQVR